ncbi:uncharacterized protein LOC129716857 isoform X3 [Wyeomyia smithii]|uniref:uncharacterized protein LOC129716857 isoform X3 n=1 Tax=Wyeomyia smithii TaxID=174621 RepID=UPI002467BBBD|nr:uncharacterized protein LOC129716857 isoform X3 [Wyeomyia smithii]XP_055522696.1 uncharacterized protein LOC129716857 isoform X3 [Wyeomyia smithii]
MPENNYSIIQTLEHKDTVLSVLPSLWIIKNGWKSYETDDSDSSSIDGDDLCYWPKGISGYRLLEKSKKDPNVNPDIKMLRPLRCTIKRNKFENYSEAFQELERLEKVSEEYGTMKKMRKDRQLQPVRSSEEPTSLLQSSNDDPTKAPDIRELLQSLHEKVDKNTRILEEYKLAEKRTFTLLSQVNAKLDVLANQINLKNFGSQNSQRVETLCNETIAAPLSPIKNFEELQSLEKQAKDQQFVEVVTKYFGSMHGKSRYVGEGGTVCLQIIDYFFDREFLLTCSWTGTSRPKNSDEVTMPKIPFYKFDRVIALFHKVVTFSDPTYPLVECQNFLKRCLRNAKQRFIEIKGVRASSARKRRKQNQNQSVRSSVDGYQEKQDEEDESSMTCEEPFVKFEEAWMDEEEENQDDAEDFD